MAAKGAGTELIVLPLAVQDTPCIEKAVATAMANERRTDVLLNLAGAGFAHSTAQASTAEIQWVMDVGFTGVMRCTKAALPIGGPLSQALSGQAISGLTSLK